MSTILTDNLKGKTTAGDVTVTSEGGAATMKLQDCLAKAGLKADSAATVSGSFNITSGTDHGTGDYSYAMTNAFSSTNYYQCGVGVSGNQGTTVTKNSGRATASVIATETATGTTKGNKNHELIAFGGLA